MVVELAKPDVRVGVGPTTTRLYLCNFEYKLNKRSLNGSVGCDFGDGARGNQVSHFVSSVRLSEWSVWRLVASYVLHALGSAHWLANAVYGSVPGCELTPVTFT